MHRAGKQLKDKGKMTIRDSGDDTTGAPLTMEVTVTTRRLEPLEKDRKVTFQARFHLGDNVHSARRDVTETKVVPELPDKEFTQVKKIDEDTGGCAQLIRTETKTDMMQEKDRTHKGKTKH